MSKNCIGRNTDLRYQLLVTVSAAALLTIPFGVQQARAMDDDVDHAQLWIELGAQFERAPDRSAVFLPHFMDPAPSFVTSAPSEIERFGLSDFGGEGKLEFRPDNSGWTFSGAVRFGRASGGRHRRQEEVARAHIPLYPTFFSKPYITATQTKLFGDVASHKVQSHTILDFSAGRDVGMGLFGHNSQSVIGAGVRFAQFSIKSDADVSAVPTVFDYVYFPFFHTSIPFQRPHAFHGTARSDRSFHGIGPSLSWDSSVNVARNDEAALMLDWGANVALLFGRQKAQVHTQTAEYHKGQYNNSRVTLYRTQFDDARSKSVAVPNLGGFAGLSVKWPSAKVSLGYRADFFFGAMDDGIETNKRGTIGFYGPFATISIGLGG